MDSCFYDGLVSDLFEGKKDKRGFLGGTWTFMDHVLVFNKRHDRERLHILAWPRGQPRALKKLWSWNISRFPALFFYLYLFFSSPLLSQLSRDPPLIYFNNLFFSIFLFCTHTFPSNHSRNGKSRADGLSGFRSFDSDLIFLFGSLLTRCSFLWHTRSMWVCSGRKRPWM